MGEQVPPNVIMWLAGGAAGLAVLLAALQAAALSGRVHATREPRGRGVAVDASTAEGSPLLRIARPWARLLGTAATPLRLTGLRDHLAEPYDRAGRPGDLSLDELLGLSLLIGVGVSVLFAVLILVTSGPALAPLGLVGLPVGQLVIASSLKSRFELRRLRVTRILPHAMDLLVLCLRSGISLPLTMRKVVDDYRDHPLGEELTRVLAEMEMGLSRREAFRSFAQRIDEDDVRTFCETVIQAEELGRPLADALEELADRLTSERALRAQMTAGRAGVMVMLPSTLVMAAALLVLFGPFIVRFLSGGMPLS